VIGLTSFSSMYPEMRRQPRPSRNYNPLAISPSSSPSSSQKLDSQDFPQPSEGHAILSFPPSLFVGENLSPFPFLFPPPPPISPSLSSSSSSTSSLMTSETSVDAGDCLAMELLPSQLPLEAEGVGGPSYADPDAGKEYEFGVEGMKEGRGGM
jgi:hypothetical protein